MSTIGGSNIVTNGLVLALDAANRRSYVSGSSVWNDISGNRNSGSLVNTPIFDSANMGSMLFGANTYAFCENNTSLQISSGSISAWIKTTNAGSSYKGIITKQQNFGLFTFDNILVTYDWGNSAQRSTGINIADGLWKNVAMTFTTNIGTPSNNAIIYLNGIAVLTTTIKLFDNTIRVEVARGGTIPSGDSQYFTGNISNTKIYNRVLSPEEIQQNYEALKSRYIY
jgi:hypothetical protein